MQSLFSIPKVALPPGTWGQERIKGYKREEIIGQHFSRFYTPEDIENGKPDAELKTAASQGRCEDEGWRIRKDGSRFWANVVITAIHDQDGKLTGFAKVTQDLTDRRKAAEEAVRHSEAQLRALFEVFSRRHHCAAISGDKLRRRTPKLSGCSATPEPSCWENQSISWSRSDFERRIPATDRNIQTVPASARWVSGWNFTACAKMDVNSPWTLCSGRWRRRRAESY